MCYVGIEYECSKDMSLQFYSKEYLRSRPEEHRGSSALLGMRLKPDRATGTHGLPLRGSVIETAVPPDTVKIPAELFFAFEKSKNGRNRYRDVPFLATIKIGIPFSFGKTRQWIVSGKRKQIKIGGQSRLGLAAVFMLELV